MDSVEALVYRPADLAKVLKVSKVTIFRMIAAGKLPAPSKLGNATYWPIDEIKSWIAQGSPNNAEWQARKKVQAGRTGR